MLISLQVTIPGPFTVDWLHSQQDESRGDFAFIYPVYDLEFSFSLYLHVLAVCRVIASELSSSSVTFSSSSSSLLFHQFSLAYYFPLSFLDISFIKMLG